MEAMSAEIGVELQVEVEKCIKATNSNKQKQIN